MEHCKQGVTRSQVHIGLGSIHHNCWDFPLLSSMHELYLRNLPVFVCIDCVKLPLDLGLCCRGLLVRSSSFWFAVPLRPGLPGPLLSILSNQPMAEPSGQVASVQALDLECRLVPYMLPGCPRSRRCFWIVSLYAFTPMVNPVCAVAAWMSPLNVLCHHRPAGLLLARPLLPCGGTPSGWPLLLQPGSRPVTI